MHAPGLSGRDSNWMPPGCGHTQVSLVACSGNLDSSSVFRQARAASALYLLYVVQRA